MELPVGSGNFSHYVEGLQTVKSPEDIFDEIEQRTGMCLKELSEEELDAQIAEVTSRIIDWL